jgi:mannose-6-phosphate isomerase-like protein (cupin superfamily)
VLFSTGHEREPWMSVYPDSDKVSGPEGLLLRSSAVGYWHGEGTAGPSEAEQFSHRHSWPVPLLERTVVELEPAEASEPYHYVHGREELLLVLAGTPTVRHPDGEERLAPGDLVCFPEGPEGAHALRNGGDSPVRALLVSTAGLPANTCYPDAGEWVLRNAPGVEVRAR